MYASKLYEVFKNEPEKAQVLYEFAAKIERSLEIFSLSATKQDLELAKKELEFQIKQLESNTLLKFKEVDAKIEITKKELEGKIETTKKELEIKIEKTRSSLLKWSFLFWLTQMSVLVGILFSFIKILSKL